MLAVIQLGFSHEGQSMRVVRLLQQDLLHFGNHFAIALKSHQCPSEN